MNSSSEISLSNIPLYTGDYEQDFYLAEISSKNALERIKYLYNEIMSPKDLNFEDTHLINQSLEIQSNHSLVPQNQYLKTCCTKVQELCLKCQNCITRCSSCNQCNCKNINSIKQNNENLIDFKESPYQSSVKSTLVKCTKPEPFSFHSKDCEWLKAKGFKVAKIKEDLDHKIEDELKIRVHTKPVPKSTHLPLYSQMVQDKEKRIALRKEKCLEILSNTKPFELHSKCKEKIKSPSNLGAEKNSHFRAKPVPKNILSNKVTERLRNKEEVRKMLMMERAQQLKEHSSLPFSQKYIPRSHSMVNIKNITKTSDEDYSKKNISEITNRLYAKKCNNAMKSWNEKVLQVDTRKNLPKENFISAEIKSKIKSAESMPFLYFPVRMSNTALLREKQIRERILARETREKKTQLNENLIKKKLNQDIAVKLRSLMPASGTEKEIDEKVKSFREWQLKRREEYEQELQEIMMRVTEQSLLLERISKVNKKVSNKKVLQKDDETESNEYESLNSEVVKAIEVSGISQSDAISKKDIESNSFPSESDSDKNLESNSLISKASESEPNESTDL